MDWNLMGTNAIGSVIDFGLNSLGSMFTNAWAARQAELNRQFQREERLATQEWNLEMWNRENEYNTPKNQLQRLIDAGVNPNSYFNNMSNVANGAPKSSPMSGAQASPVSPPTSLIGSGIANYYQNKLLASQSKLVDAEAEGQQQNNDVFDVKFFTDIRSAWKQMDVADAQISKYNEEVKKLKSETHGIDLSNAITEQTTQEQIDMIKLTYSTMLIEYENAKKQGNLLDEQIETENKRQDEISSNIAVNNSQVSLNNANQKLIEGKIDEQDELTKQSEIETGIRQYYVKECGFVPSDDLIKFQAWCINNGEKGQKAWEDYVDALDDKRDAETTYNSLKDIFLNKRNRDVRGTRLCSPKDKPVVVNGNVKPGWNPRYSTTPR